MKKKAAKKAVKKSPQKVSPTLTATVTEATGKAAGLAEAFYIQKNYHLGVERLSEELMLTTEAVQAVLDDMPVGERKVKVANFNNGTPGVVAMTPAQADDDDDINKAAARQGNMPARMGSFHKIHPGLPSR